MKYRIGDQVVHLTFGPGRIIAIDEKRIAGKTRKYYVVDTGEMKIWVLLDYTGEKSIRPPTGSFEFKKLLTLLGSPGEGLSDHHRERKSQLDERMHQRIMVNICFVIRELTSRSKIRNLTFSDQNVLRRAEEYLLDEWELSLDTSRSSAVKELDVILGAD